MEVLIREATKFFKYGSFIYAIPQIIALLGVIDNFNPEYHAAIAAICAILLALYDFLKVRPKE